MSKNSSQQYDANLHKLAEEVTRAILWNKDGSIQRDQVELLMDLEKKFLGSLSSIGQTRLIYKEFILKVAVENKNILSARPYFRERADVFSSQITPAIKNGDIKKLKTFHINYNLVKFIVDHWMGKFPEESQDLFLKLTDARRRLIENNMPLAINRAKRFYRKVPRNHLSLMDLINIAGMGLVSGIDKYVGEYSKAFNGTCIGRMTGNMIDDYSETTLHFYPSDRSILYRANSLRFRLGTEDLGSLADAMNKSYDEDKKKGIRTPKDKITISKLAELLSAASPVSADETVGAENETPVRLIEIAPLAVEDAPSAEEVTIKQDAISKMAHFAKKLPMIQRKILRLKGVKL